MLLLSCDSQDRLKGPCDRCGDVGRDGSLFRLANLGETPRASGVSCEKGSPAFNPNTRARVSRRASRMPRFRVAAVSFSLNHPARDTAAVPDRRAIPSASLLGGGLGTQSDAFEADLRSAQEVTRIPNCGPCRPTIQDMSTRHFRPVPRPHLQSRILQASAQ